MNEIVNGPNHYGVIKEVARSEYYHLYLCVQEDTKRECLLQIASVAEHNGKIQRAAYILTELARHADKLEAEYEKIRADPKILLNYKFGFPELVDSFIYQEQGGRQINILAFRNVDDVADMVPLINITDKDKLRIDLRTSAWIMGKILKLLDFIYSQGISIDFTSGDNILINVDKHYVVFFDWTKASWSEMLEIDPVKVQRNEIAQAAQAVVIALGGNVETGFFPEDGNKEYINYLLKLARGDTITDAKTAHKNFYEIVNRIWKREFHPFTVKPLGLDEMKEKDEKDMMEE